MVHSHSINIIIIITSKGMVSREGIRSRRRTKSEEQRRTERIKREKREYVDLARERVNGDFSGAVEASARGGTEPTLSEIAVKDVLCILCACLNRGRLTRGGSRSAA